MRASYKDETINKTALVETAFKTIVLHSSDYISSFSSVT